MLVMHEVRDSRQFFNLISKLFQPNLKARRSGMDRRNLGSMDCVVLGHPCNLDSGGPCRNDDEPFILTMPPIAPVTRKHSKLGAIPQ